MGSLKAVCGLAVVALLLSGCGGGSNGSAGSPATSIADTGTGSSSSPPAATGTATLSWTAPSSNTDGSALTDLAGFHIRYGTTQGALTDSVDVPSAGAMSYVVRNLNAGTWYFAVSAYTLTGLESTPSNVGSKTIS